MATIANLVATLGLDASDYDRTVQNVTKSASGLGAAINSAVSTAAGFVVANVAMKAFETATSAVSGGIIGMNANLQKSTLQFETLMGSADQAREHVKMLFEFAKATPFETQPVIDASRMLQTFGGAALNTKENLTLIGDAAAATSAPIQELGFWVGRAYSAIQAGQPFGEAAMRLQELAVLSPQARAEIERLQESGASASEVWAVMEKDLGRFEGAMKRQEGTWEGLTSTFTDTLGILSSTALKPFFEMASGGLAQLNDLLGSESVSQAVQGFAETLAGGLQGAMDTLGTVITGVKALVAAFTVDAGAMGIVLDTIRNLFGDTVANAVQPFIDGFMRAIPAIKEFISSGLQALQDPMGTAKNLLADFAPTGERLAKLFDALRGAVVALVPKPMVDMVSNLFNMTEAAIGGENPINTLANVVNSMSGAVEGATRFVAEHKEVQVALAGVVGAAATAWTLSTAAAVAHKAAIGAITIATNVQAAAQAALNAVMAANPIGLVITALAGLVAAFIYAYQTSEEFRNFVDNGMTIVKNAIEGMVTSAGIAFTTFQTTISTAWDTVRTTAETTWAAIQTTVSEAWETIKTTTRDAVNAVIRAINTMIKAWNSIEFHVPSIEIPKVELPGGITVGGGSIGGFSVAVPQVPLLSEIPAYASGGLALRPQLAMVGEVPEAVIPLRDLPTLIPALASKESGIAPASGDTFTFNVIAREAAITERELFRHAERARLLRAMGA